MPCAHQLLQHRFEIAARDALALGDLGRAHRRGAAVIGDVEHRLDREEQFLGQPDHRIGEAAARGSVPRSSFAGRLAGQAEAMPVEPKPPAWRAPVSPKTSATTANSGRAMRVKTSCAMRSPGRIAIARRRPAGLRFQAEIRQRPLVIGVDQPDRVAEHQPLAMAEARARQHQRAPFGIADAERDPGRDQHRRRLRLQARAARRGRRAGRARRRGSIRNAGNPSRAAADRGSSARPSAPWPSVRSLTVTLGSAAAPSRRRRCGRRAGRRPRAWSSPASPRPRPRRPGGSCCGRRRRCRCRATRRWRGSSRSPCARAWRGRWRRRSRSRRQSR